MRSVGNMTTTLGKRRAWKPPVITILAIGSETKSSREGGRSVEISGPARAQFAQPQPPAAPTAKLGFSFEMSFPLSARIES
jgi:hypothetical protein